MSRSCRPSGIYSCSSVQRFFSSHSVNPAAVRPLLSHVDSKETVERTSLNPTGSNSEPNFPDAKGLMRQGKLFDSSHRLQLPAAELRNACKCNLCVNPSDRQRNYHWAEIPPHIAVASYEVDAAGTHHVRWENDVPGFEDHISSYTKADILSARAMTRKHGHTIFRRPVQLWDSKDYNIESATIAYSDFMKNPRSLAWALQQLYSTGLAFITGVPKSELSVGKIAKRIGPLRTTFYGDTWDVRSVPDAKNVAYTSRNLGFHMDLLYMQESPGLQLLHCIENTCEGGHSRFVDTFKALEVLISQYGEQILYDLAKITIPYEYSNDGFYYFDRKPIVSLGGYPFKNRTVTSTAYSVLSNVQRVYWSPPFTAPHFRVAGQLTNDRMSYAAQLRTGKLFAEALDAPGMAVTTKLSAGTCVIFDNLRVCHARTAFDTIAGHRWLRGAYIDHQDFHSKMVELAAIDVGGYYKRRPFGLPLDSQDRPEKGQ